MKFRDLEIDDILVVGPFEGPLLEKELRTIANSYNIIDLQYSTSVAHRFVGHSALVLVRNK